MVTLPLLAKSLAPEGETLQTVTRAGERNIPSNKTPPLSLLPYTAKKAIITGSGCLTAPFLSHGGVII